MYMELVPDWGLSPVLLPSQPLPLWVAIGSRGCEPSQVFWVLNMVSVCHADPLSWEVTECWPSQLPLPFNNALNGLSHLC